MNVRIVPILTLALLLCGCGSSKKASEGVPPGYSSSDREGGRVILPIGGTKQPVSEDEGLPGSPSMEGRTGSGSYKAPERTEIRFDKKECEHVRIAGINPLPESARLELPLDHMKAEFCYPVPGHLLSRYGQRGNAFHTGTDIKAQAGDTIYAAFPGVVRMSKYYSSYGNVVVIRHYYGFETLYAHNSVNLVDVNEEVEAGDPIALAGDTGRATGTHLHFEVRAAGDHVDPEKMIDTENHCLRSGTLYIEPRFGQMLAFTGEDELKRIENEAAVKEEADRKAVEAAEARAAEIAKQREKEETASASAEYHTVKSGDTLYGLALKYKTTVKKLCNLNGINDKSILSIGQKLRIK